MQGTEWFIGSKQSIFCRMTYSVKQEQQFLLQSLPSDNGTEPETLILEPDTSRKIWGSIPSLYAVTDNLSESSCLFVPEAVGAIYVRDSYRKRNC